MKALRSVRATAVPRSGHFLALVTLSLIVRPSLLAAQTAGNPIVYSTGVPAGTAASTSYIDAYAATSGTDICARINTAWGMVLGQAPTGNTPPNVNSVTVDARGFTGSWNCESSPFTPSGTSLLPNGVLLLGNAIITTSVTWFVPSHTSLIGIGGGNTTVGSGYGVNTVIRAADPFAANSPVLQMGASSSKGGPWFGIIIRNLTVDCNAQANCVGIFNNEAEENSMVEQVQIWDAPSYGLHVSAANTNDTSHPGATNSGPYRNIEIAYTSNCGSACNAAVGLQVDGPGTQISGSATARSIREFNDITVTGHGAGYLIGPAVVIVGVSTAFTNSHIEYAQTGLAIGNVSSTSPCTFGTISGNCVTDGVEVSNVSIGTLTGNPSQIAVAVGNSTSGAPATYDVTLTGIANQTVNAKSTTLQDNMSGTTLSSGSDPYIGLYALGRCPAGASCLVVKNTQ
jgi:hypothetical protein